MLRLSRYFDDKRKLDCDNKREGGLDSIKTSAAIECKSIVVTANCEHERAEAMMRRLHEFEPELGKV